MATYQEKPFIVITSKYEVLKVTYERVLGWRLMWTCSDLNVFVVGPLPGMMYEQAANLAMQECVARNIPPRSLRSCQQQRKPIVNDTKSRRMF